MRLDFLDVPNCSDDVKSTHFRERSYQLCRVQLQQWQPSKRGLNSVHEVASYVNKAAIQWEVEIIFQADGLFVNCSPDWFHPGRVYFRVPTTHLSPPRL